MRILLLTPLVHQSKQFGEQTVSEVVPELPPDLKQHFWVKALRNHGHEVRVIRYTDSGLLDQRTVHQLTSALGTISSSIPRALSFLKRRIPNHLNIDYYARNQKVLAEVDEFRPELSIIVGGYTELFPDTVRAIRDGTAGPFVATNGVGPYDWGIDTVDRQVAAECYDVMFVNDRYRQDAWRSVGTNAVVLPVLGCDLEYVDSIVATDPTLAPEVSFIGQPYPRRVQYLSALTELDIDLAIYGPRWDDTPLEPYHRGEIWGEDMWNVLYNSNISINVHHRTQLTGGNLRLFEVPGTGTMQISDAVGDGWFVEGEEIVTVDTPAELREAVSYYLSNDDERERIAQKGRERVRSEHTYDHRMAELVEMATTDAGVPDGVVNPSYLDRYGRF